MPVKYRGPKSLLRQDPHAELGLHTYWNWRVMPYGYKRRNAILKWLESNPENYIAINKKWCIILKHDPDMKRLLKQGKVWMDKIGSRKCTMSVLRLVNLKEQVTNPFQGQMTAGQTRR